MSLNHFLQKSKPVAASAWAEFEMESDMVAEAVEEMVVANSALEQLESLEASLESVIEIEDNATATIALTAVLASDGYAGLRPSLEAAEEADAKEESKGVIKRLIDGAIGIAQSVYDALVKFIKGIFDKTLRIETAATKFDKKVKDLKGKPKAAKITLPKSTAVLFTESGFDKEILNKKVYKELHPLFTDTWDKTIVMGRVKTFEEVTGELFAGISKITHKDNPVKECAAIEVSDIQKAAGVLVFDTAIMGSARKKVYEPALKSFEKALKEAKAQKDKTDEVFVKRLKLTTKVLSAATKAVLGGAYAVQSAKLTALVAFAKNIEEPTK